MRKYLSSYATLLGELAIIFLNQIPYRNAEKVFVQYDKVCFEKVSQYGFKILK